MYTTLHAAVLIKSDGLFHCEECDTILEAGGADSQGDTLNRRERTRLVKAKQVCNLPLLIHLLGIPLYCLSKVSSVQALQICMYMLERCI